MWFVCIGVYAMSFFLNFVNLSYVQLFIIPNWLVDIARDYLSQALYDVFSMIN